MEKVQLFGLVSQRNESLPLGGGERAALAAAEQAEMVDILQQRKVLEGVGCLCCALLTVLQRTFADHSLDLAPGIGTALAGAFVEGALAQENVEIPGFQLLRRKGLPQLALGAEDGADFLRHHVPSYRCDVLAALIPLARGVQRVLQQHFSHGAVAFFNHESPVFADGGQKLAILLRGFGFAVGAKAAPLCNVQENAGKFGTRNRCVQRLDAQCIDVLQFTCKEGIQLCLGDHIFC